MGNVEISHPKLNAARETKTVKNASMGVNSPIRCRKVSAEWALVSPSMATNSEPKLDQEKRLGTRAHADRKLQAL